MTDKPLDGKNVFIVGGSGGLGKEMAKVMASQGAHITIFSRKQAQLGEGREEILRARSSDAQRVIAVAGDMGVASTAQTALTSQPSLPDILYCVAGGTPYDLGFFIDLSSENFERCMANNYFSSVYPAQTVLRQWIEDDKDRGTPVPPKPKQRRIVFVNSSASLIPTPGYVAYSAAKAAQRSLADTLRLEALRHSNAQSTYIVQCVFAHNFITPTFLEEQKHKPLLTKRIEGTDSDPEKLDAGRFPTAEKIAPEIVKAVMAGTDFAVMDGRLEPQVLWANMVGTSPRRGWGIVDVVLGWVMWIVFPFVRRGVERLCREDGKEVL